MFSEKKKGHFAGLSLGLLLGCLVSVAHFPCGSDAKVTDVRLPSNVRPLHYDVQIKTLIHYDDPKDFRFEGRVRIVVQCMNATDKVIIHSKNLTIDPFSIKFRNYGKYEREPISFNWIEVDDDREFIIFTLNKNMQAGQVVALQLSFSGPIRDDLIGLYYSSYQNGFTGKTSYVVGTHFQPTHARKVFPCMDEPALKATFNIQLVRPVTHIGISNMPLYRTNLESVIDNVTYVKESYQKTPLMSTYLLAFVVCNYDYLEKPTKRGKKFRVLSRPDMINSAQQSLDVGVELMDLFEDFFEIDYPLPKMDMVSLPDFNEGAMENWGLILHRDAYFLVTPGITNERCKEFNVEVVGHELAHQWFGNIVSPAWWDDLWLSEGFGSFMGYLGLDHVYSGQNMFELLVNRELHTALRVDSLASSQPIFMPVSHPDDIAGVFNDITYKKGSSLVRMMRHFLGFETFRRGLVRYLNDRQYGSATQDQLWQSLSEKSQIDGSNIDVKSVMDTWTLQKNYPIVTVTRDSSNAGNLKVTQKRYLKDPSAAGNSTSPFGYRWNIPLTFTSSQMPNFNESMATIHWMHKTEQQKTLSIGSDKLPAMDNSDGWILANVQQNGYYRVSYDTDNWEALGRQLKQDHTVISVINRAQIINDAWYLVKSGEVSITTALKVIEYLEDETEYVPWATANAELGYVRSMLKGDMKDAFQTFLEKTSRQAYSKFGFTNETSPTRGNMATYMHVLIITLACSVNNQMCEREASNLFGQWMANPNANPIPADLKAGVYCNTVKQGGQREWDFLLERFIANTDAAEANLMIYGLSCPSNDTIKSNYLNMVIADDSIIRKQDAASAISYVSDAWDFFDNNYDLLFSRFSDGSYSWNYMIDQLTNHRNTQKELDEVKALYNLKKAEGKLGSSEITFENAIETIESNIKWMATNEQPIRTWLIDNNYLLPVP